jgi:hypothetical protein
MSACARPLRHFGHGIGPSLKATILTKPRSSQRTLLAVAEARRAIFAQGLHTIALLYCISLMA